VTDLLGDPDPLIRVLDFEATGLEADALIVEVGYTDLNARTRELGDTVATLCRVPAMPPATRAVHHIRAEETQGFPPYDRWCLFEEAVRAGVWGWAAHSAQFEERFILGHLPMFCTNKAALRLWPEAPGQSVFALLYWLEDAGRVRFNQDRAHPPHRAGPDSYATAVLLQAMLNEGVTGNQLRQWSMEPRIFPTVPIGDWRGKPWSAPDRGFLEWILRKIDDPEIRFNAALELERRDQPHE
jgi:exodeoxyribonuclease X